MNEPGKVIIRATNWLGDSVITIPAVRAVRQVCPSASISLIAPRAFTDLWENEPSVDRVIPISRPTPLGEKLRLIRLLRSGRYDLGVLFPNSFESALWFYLGGVHSRLGYVKCGRGMLLNRRFSPPEIGGHQVRHYLDLVRALGDFTVEPRPSVRVPENARRRADELLDGFGLEEGETLIGINPGAAYGEAKCWPRDSFAGLIKILCDRLGARIIVVGSASERGQAESLRSGMEQKVFNVAGKTSIMQLAAVAQRCSVFVTNDTGPMHLACAVGTPVVAIFGPTDPEATGPLGESVIVREKVDCAPCMKRECPTDHRCMTAISSEEVYQAVVQLLK